MYPEHAELFRLRIRSIETRPKSSPWTSAVGERIALHAGIRDPESAAARRDPISRRAMDTIPHGDPIPRGVLLGTVELLAVVPTELVQWTTRWTPARPECGYATRRVNQRPQYVVVDEDQRELGDFSPGNFALLFRDLSLLCDPIPARGAVGLWALDAEQLAELEGAAIFL